MSYKDVVLKQPCECISCPDCGGSGNLWVTLDGKYHKHRCDDMGDLETCDTCGGSGITESCDRCNELEQIERDEEDAQDTIQSFIRGHEVISKRTNTLALAAADALGALLSPRKG